MTTTTLRSIRHAVTGFAQGATFTLLAALAIPSAAWPAEPAKRPQPIRSITVKVMPEEAFHGREEHYRITTLTATTCTVQVDAASLRAQGEPLLLKAFRACLSAKPERAGCRTLTLEDGSKARAVIGKDGTWDQAGCDQRKIKN